MSQLHLTMEASFLTNPRHQSAVSTVAHEGPSVLDPLTEGGCLVDVSSTRGAVDEDHDVAEPLAPADGAPDLGGYLNAAGVEVPALLQPRVRLHLHSLPTEDHIEAIEESLRILADPLSVGIGRTHQSKDASLEFLADVEAALALLGVPV